MSTGPRSRLVRGNRGWAWASWSVAALLGMGCGDGDKGRSAAAAASAAVPTSTVTASPSAPGTSGARGGAPAAASGSAAAGAGAPALDELDPNRVAAEPRRKTLRAAADDPALYANRDLVADRYGVVQLPFPLEVQEVPLPHALRALLFTGEGAALGKPMILVVGADDKVVWSKERPLAGTHERARELTISRGPHGEVFLFWYDEASHLLAAREWTYDGGIFADFVVLASEACDAASVLYWPGRGWVAALREGDTLRIQILGENGLRSFREEGAVIPLGPGASRPAPRSPGAPATSAALGRPQIAVIEDRLLEITVGTRKLRISPADGALVK